MTKVLDETGQIEDAELIQCGRYQVAVIDGRWLLPGAYTLLTSVAETRIEAAIRRVELTAQIDTRAESAQIG